MKTVTVYVNALSNDVFFMSPKQTSYTLFRAEYIVDDRTCNVYGFDEHGGTFNDCPTFSIGNADSNNFMKCSEAKTIIEIAFDVLRDQAKRLERMFCEKCDGIGDIRDVDACISTINEILKGFKRYREGVVEWTNCSHQCP